MLSVKVESEAEVLGVEVMSLLGVESGMPPARGDADGLGEALGKITRVGGRNGFFKTRSACPEML